MRLRHRLPLVAIVLTAAISFPLGALASHQFSDVPNGNQYHADIAALAGSGVTTGCGGGQYCPSDFVTREQMAAFMNRLGALQAGRTPVVNAAQLDGHDAIAVAAGEVVIPSGTTVTGYDGWDGSSAGSGDVIFVVDLPARAPEPLANDDVNFAPAMGLVVNDADAGCTGSAAAPTAPEGKLCLYIDNESGVSAVEGFRALADGFEDRAFLVQFFTNEPASNNLFLMVTWAYTAP